MIKSFKKSKIDARAILEREQTKTFPKNLQDPALYKLLTIHYAASPEDLRIPAGNRLEILKGNRKGQYSIRINDQWRICFRWENNHAVDVEIVDYH